MTTTMIPMRHRIAIWPGNRRSKADQPGGEHVLPARVLAQ